MGRPALRRTAARVGLDGPLRRPAEPRAAVSGGGAAAQARPRLRAAGPHARPHGARTARLLRRGALRPCNDRCPGAVRSTVPRSGRRQPPRPRRRGEAAPDRAELAEAREGLERSSYWVMDARATGIAQVAYSVRRTHTRSGGDGCSAPSADHQRRARAPPPRPARAGGSAPWRSSSLAGHRSAPIRRAAQPAGLDQLPPSVVDRRSTLRLAPCARRLRSVAVELTPAGRRAAAAASPPRGERQGRSALQRPSAEQLTLLHEKLSTARQGPRQRGNILPVLRATPRPAATSAAAPRCHGRRRRGRGATSSGRVQARSI